MNESPVVGTIHPLEGYKVHLDILLSGKQVRLDIPLSGKHLRLQHGMETDSRHGLETDSRGKDNMLNNLVTDRAGVGLRTMLAQAESLNPKM